MKKLSSLLIILLFTLLICISCSNDQLSTPSSSPESSKVQISPHITARLEITPDNDRSKIITIEFPEYFSSADEFGKFLEKYHEYMAPFEIPWPHYIPEGYKIQFTQDTGPFLTISNDNRQKIEYEIDWHPNGIGFWKMLPYHPIVEFNGTEGQFIENDNVNSIIWNWMPEKTKPGLYVLRLEATQNIPVEELVLIANSVDF